VRRWHVQNREYELEYKRQYRVTHKESIQKYQSKWLKENIETTRAINNNRRAREKSAPGTATAEQRRARWELYGGLCYFCGKQAEHMDHVKPLTKGGANWPCNLRPICRSCNSKKRVTWPYQKVLEVMGHETR
jgi:5-methylcytosine-specific restriction endonuclease McrA